MVVSPFLSSPEMDLIDNTNIRRNSETLQNPRMVREKRPYCDYKHTGPLEKNSSSEGTLRTHSTRSSRSNSSINSIDNDSIDFSTPTKESPDSSSVPVTPINNISYVHGGYAGAAPLFMNDKKWMMILQHLMPEQYQIISNYSKQTNGVIDPLKIMKWAENSPVVAAYGMLHSKKYVNTAKEEDIRCLPTSKRSKQIMKELSQIKLAILSQEAANKQRGKRMKSQRSVHVNPALEWDVFLDPTIVKQVDLAMQKMEALMDDRDNEIYYEEITAANIEVDRQVSRLMNRMMLAHGSAAQLLVEAVGVAAKYNFSRVVKTTRKLQKKIKQEAQKNWFGCGTTNTTVDEKSADIGSKTTALKTSAIFVNQWLRIFASALKLGHQSADSIAFLVAKGGVRKDKLNKSRSREVRKSRFLRGNLSSMSFDNESLSTVHSHEIGEKSDNLPLCGLFLCLGMSDPASENADHDVSTMAESAELVRKLLGERLRLVLDMKSRHVPARVWGRLIDNLRARGLEIDGIGSFDIDELRQIESGTSTPVTSILFFHSAGDLQRACHANEIKKNDTVYFNAGSLMWKRQTVCEATQCWSTSKYQGLNQVYSDGEADENFELSSFQPYAYPKGSFDDDEITVCKATLADYQKHFDLNIGLYVQEFSIGSEELDKLVRLVNKYPDLYKCGLAWGGLNGVSLKNVKGDGYWSQRYVGRSWSFNAFPSRRMTLIAPEDHHAVQKAIMYGACGQVSTVNHLLEEEENIICQHSNVIAFTQTGNLRDL